MQDFILALPVLIFSLTAHEYAHAAVAHRYGDDTAYMLGRVTLNPVPHIDLWMSIVLPALIWFGSGYKYTFGGAKPVPVNTRKLRPYVRGDVAVSAAGVITNLCLSLLFAMLFVAIGLAARGFPAAAPTLDALQRMMTWGIWLNLMLAVFNLIPIPPLDGSKLLYHLLPPAWGLKYRSLDQYGYFLLFGLMFLSRDLFVVLLSPAFMAMRAILGLILPYHIADGWDIFSG